MTRTGICTECGSEFTSGARGPVGIYCGSCRVARSREASARWKQRNSASVHEKQHAYHAANRDAEVARCRRWRDENKAHVRIYRRRIYEERQRDTSAAVVAEYRRRNPGKHAEIENRRRARMLGQFVEPVDVKEIRARDRGLCGICGGAVSHQEQSIDHIIPIARGGLHERANVQLAHRVCNSRKGARLITT